MARVAGTAAAAAGAVGLGWTLIDREPRPPPSAVRVKEHRVERPVGAGGMAIARRKDPATNVRRAIEAMGGMGAFVRRGERVAVKPNVGWNRLPDQAANTDPQVVAEVVRLPPAAGAPEVGVVGGPV